MSTDDRTAAAEALGAIDRAGGSVADRLVTPWWYHPVLGAALGAIVLAVGLAPRTPAGSACVVAVALAASITMGALVAAYRRLTGLWVSGDRIGPRARRPWLPLILVLGAAMAIVCSLFATGTHLPWLAVATAVVGAVAVVVLGRRFDTALRADLRAGSPSGR